MNNIRLFGGTMKTRIKIVCRYLDEQTVLHGETKTFILSILSSHILS